MTVLTSYPFTSGAFEVWLKEQIQQLSVDTLKSRAVTCTACGEVVGTYIVEYQGHRSRYSPAETYALLKFIAEQA
ncbi:hypothetical protein BST81_15965 [Leptolyngbya sp. 'hensonii']|uniref:hypothetical protein n=1 Tax=Leptolyngbya sp. 'hensonii' TaxID=1922337 RepID=UPI00094F68CE|nr:hypothetical protein [Leptolyngbya sp. 'hensonii']OLP17305.1 hypothetical protein BST81_15965 [Leptolyngbya sp. 'hensonii']